jgi:hypothetical protein
MFRPLNDAHGWFLRAQAAPTVSRLATQPKYPPYGAVVLTDGTTVELDYTNRMDEKKINNLPPDQVAGIGWRDRFTGEWSVTVRGNLYPAHEAKGATLADALRAALDACYTAEAAEIALRENAPAHLERELARHDWWHMMSDSYAVTLAGQKHMTQIRSIAAKIPASTVRALWAKYAPKDYPDSPF